MARLFGRIRDDDHDDEVSQYAQVAIPETGFFFLSDPKVTLLMSACCDPRLKMNFFVGVYFGKHAW